MKHWTLLKFYIFWHWYYRARQLSNIRFMKVCPFLQRNDRAQVVIEEKNRLADVVFPLKPLVVSLRDYDQAATAESNPINGYPVICVTVSSCSN